MPKILVDGQELEVKAGENILEACLNAGLDLPYFCWHPAMGSIGSCRQCAVIQYQNEDDTRGKIVMGCMTPVSDGARFSIQADNAREFREAIIESLMINHPHDCPVCAEGGECHLQDMTVMVGHRDRRYRGLKKTHRNQYLGPLIHHEMNRCITCYRCVRFYKDYAGGSDLSAQACHDHIYFGRHQEGVLENEFSGNLVEVCPTGVFTDKPFLKQYTRKWDLQSAPSVCNGCAVGCNTLAGERYGLLKRIHNRYNHEVNGYFLCDRGRFGSGYINSASRLDYAGLKNADGSFSAITQERALDQASAWVKGKKVLAIGSPRASLEANWLLKELVGKENFACGFSDQEFKVNLAIVQALKEVELPIPSIKAMETADAILVLGEDITNTAPRVALGLRQAVRNKAFELAGQAKFFDWQDAAIRNLAQDQRSPLIIVSPMDTRLDDVASDLVTLPPQHIAEFANAITRCLTGIDSGEQTVDLDSTAAKIAGQLRKAKRPLIISGTGLLRQDVVKAASEIARALIGDECKPMLSYCLSEANSLGLTLLGGKSLTDVLSEDQVVDTLIILENDLSRRLPGEQFHQLLQKPGKVIGLDVVENATLDNCDLVLPSASLVESEGTLVSSEGRAQRYFPVMEPKEQRLPNWQWLLKLAKAMDHGPLGELQYFDQVVEACASAENIFSKITAAAPGHQFRSHNKKIPRQPHRYSGRTAIRANLSVNEPQQPIDDETPLAYSMEGSNRDQPAALTPFVWAPGWNSNQSVQKFQVEAGGEMRGGTAGVKLLDTGFTNQQPRLVPSEDVRVADQLEPHTWQLVPVYKVHGSEELSSLTDEVAELSGPGFIVVGEVVAKHHGVKQGDGLIVGIAGNQVSLEVRLAKRLAKNCIGFSTGFASTMAFTPGEHATLAKDEHWQPRKPQIIASDSGQAGKAWKGEPHG